VCATLDRLGIFYRSGVARTGVIAEIGQGKAVVVRGGDKPRLPTDFRAKFNRRSNRESSQS